MSFDLAHKTIFLNSGGPMIVALGDDVYHAGVVSWGGKDRNIAPVLIRIINSSIITNN